MASKQGLRDVQDIPQLRWGFIRPFRTAGTIAVVCVFRRVLDLLSRLFFPGYSSLAFRSRFFFPLHAALGVPPDGACRQARRGLVKGFNAGAPGGCFPLFGCLVAGLYRCWFVYVREKYC